MKNAKSTLELVASSRSYVVNVDGQVYRMSVTEKGKMSGFIYLSAINGADTISRTARFDEIGNGENKIAVAYGQELDAQIASFVKKEAISPDITPKAVKKPMDFSKLKKSKDTSAPAKTTKKSKVIVPDLLQK